MALLTALDTLDKSSDVRYICSMPNEIKAHRNLAFSCRYHMVFCPKVRRKVLVPPINDGLKTILLETIEKWGQEFPVSSGNCPLWTNSYFVATTGGVMLETLKRYDEGQKNR
jgi:putative transposase